MKQETKNPLPGVQLQTMGEAPRGRGGGRVQNLVVESVEKFTIEMTDTGMGIIDREGTSLTFSPVEALMLLDILKHEEQNLRKMADEASPLPMRFHFDPS